MSAAAAVSLWTDTPLWALHNFDADDKLPNRFEDELGEIERKVDLALEREQVSTEPYSVGTANSDVESHELKNDICRPRGALIFDAFFYLSSIIALIGLVWFVYALLSGSLGYLLPSVILASGSTVVLALAAEIRAKIRTISKR